MEQSRPGGWVGLIVVVALFLAGYIFNVEWMRFWGGTCTTIWVAMLVIGYLAGAKR
jgi:hypothetical protein